MTPEPCATPSSATPPTVKKVRCPTCAGDSVYAPSNAYRPFCSERCKNIDLGAWASEQFALPTKPDDELGQEPD